LKAACSLGAKEMEEALADLLSVRRFCGFRLEEGTPDETTIWRFREAAMTVGIVEAAFAEIDRQLEMKGLVLKKGTMLDATLVTAKHAPPTRAAGMGAGHPQEPAAGLTKKGGQPHLGYHARLCRPP